MPHHWLLCLRRFVVDLDLVQVAKLPGKRQGIGNNRMVPIPEIPEGFYLGEHDKKDPQET